MYILLSETDAEILPFVGTQAESVTLKKLLRQIENAAKRRSKKEILPNFFRV